jgi:hypothetical protein
LDMAIAWPCQRSSPVADRWPQRCVLHRHHGHGRHRAATATDGMEDPAGPLEPSTRMTSEWHIKWHRKGCRCTFLPDRVNKSGSSR